ncbi:PfkB family carbohydrate kinase [Rhodophyticola sp. SM2404]
MDIKPDILCIGSVLWDIIGRTDLGMELGNDKPGRITRLPGGVALNIAMTLAQFGMRPALISVVGEDREGAELLQRCREMGLLVDYMTLNPDLPTDQYMAIEAQGHLTAALADAHSLEAAGADILAPLADGRLGDERAPWDGLIALDGNLTTELLAAIAQSELFMAADLRLAPASPGKAERLRALLSHERATLYVNCEEAGLITGSPVKTAVEGAQALIKAGARRVLVTHGAEMAVDADADTYVSRSPPQVVAKRITGAGDTFMAVHIAAEAAGLDRGEALARALAAAADYVAG